MQRLPSFLAKKGDDAIDDRYVQGENRMHKDVPRNASIATLCI